MTNEYKFETKAIHAGQEVDPTTGARALPIYQTTSFVFEDTQDGADKFALAKGGNIYTRLMNPTSGAFEARVTELEGGSVGLAVASGMAAITYAILTLAHNGDHVVSTSSLYGGTHTLFTHTFKNYGVDVSIVNTKDLQNVENAIQENTKAIFIETIGNPEGNVEDIEALADIAHKNGIPLIVDNTFATPYLCRPIEFGADIIVHSATKFIGGHGTSIGGVIVESGKFDWKQNDKFKGLSEPDDSYHGMIFADVFGPGAFVTKIRTSLLRDTGAAISPFNSFLLAQGLESLPVRMDRHIENAQKVAEYLNNHEKIEWVDFAGLPDNPYYELKNKYLPKGAGAIFTFGVKGGYEAGIKFIEALELFSLLANVGDAKSLVVHPASMTHSQLTEKELALGGVKPETIRVSIGLEHIDDIIADLEKGLGVI
ncbi:O-acetylhomoserine aminocarboxypropyltransferase/cysteine synthase family protein [Jeotgalibaca ciconiae]|uniref:O-acetylhomoserine aminocarboxypropyltransferase/cysteine synthase n=1 Tax=Jeotgalibaca ciconiae TaxID=2496265 RepID=A0A3Q9BIZ9_9LACT|nr:O-acetylhomoserine aminocarboxypropyltransferase/cysteine synthase family protein [Jeotgalibaca ciconiae]AZP03489.1 O-acetylhomoserine aminocarboxypropyltransferase/cysteine synthase [Jeotgalibaca ciconiae]